MTLMNGLHHEGLGSCPMNWSVSPDQDRTLRRAVPIRDSEVVVCLFAVGNLPEKLRVPVSIRRDTDDVLIVVDDAAPPPKAKER